MDNGFRVNFEDKFVEVSRDGVIKATGLKQSNGRCRMFFRRPRKNREVNVTATGLKTWHERLGHIHKRALVELVRRGLVEGVSVENATEFFCEACRFGKLHKLPFRKEKKVTSSKPGEIIHSDVGGPLSINSIGGARYYVLFKDDTTGVRFVYFIRHKSDVYDRFVEFERLLNNKFGRTMQTFRSDNGTEFCNTRMREYMKTRGITFETTAPYMPEQNGKSERDNRTIVEAARTMLQAKRMPAYLWAEAVATAVYILNRTGNSRSKEGCTPYEQWTGRRPDLRHVRVFGSDAYAHVPKQRRRSSMLEPRSLSWWDTTAGQPITGCTIP